MVNFHDPSVVTQNYLVLVKLWHFIDGIYLWEFFTTLDYEWAVIRGRRPYRWTIWIYSLSRVAGLTSVTLNLIGTNVTTALNCQLWLTSELTACLLSTSAASLLIVLRIIAIWNRNRVVMAIALSIWGVYFATLIQAVVRVRSVWMPAESGCVARNVEVTIINIVATLGIDIVLLIMMLAGMIPLRRLGGGMFCLSGLLWKQGVIWLLLATAVEVPPVVLIALDLNYPLNVISRVPSLIIMTVAGTRMHRQLVDFAYASTDIVHDDVPQISLDSSKIEQARTPQAPLNRKDVTTILVFAQPPTPQEGDDESDISTNTNEQVHEKAIGFSLDNDVERGT